MSVSAGKLSLEGSADRGGYRRQTQEESITLYGHGWTPETVPQRRTVTIKMLRVTIDLQGCQVTQARATKLRYLGDIMAAQKKQRDNVVLTATVSSITCAAYTAQFTAWTTQVLADLGKTLNKLDRKDLCIMSSIPTASHYVKTRKLSAA